MPKPIMKFAVIALGASTLFSVPAAAQPATPEACSTAGGVWQDSGNDGTCVGYILKDNLSGTGNRPESESDSATDVSTKGFLGRLGTTAAKSIPVASQLATGRLHGATDPGEDVGAEGPNAAQKATGNTAGGPNTATGYQGRDEPASGDATLGYNSDDGFDAGLDVQCDNVDNNCDGDVDEDAPANHNTTRSNRSSAT
jgi:hypothetical protein